MLTPHHLLVPWSRKSRVIPLLPLWTVRTVQSLSACTGVYFTFFLQHEGDNWRTQGEGEGEGCSPAAPKVKFKENIVLQKRPYES